MSKKDSAFFRQLPPPQLAKILTINQPQSELIFQHWKHLISALEWEAEPNFRVMCLMYKSNASVNTLCFQEGCLLYQKKFKILYGQVQEITCLKMHPITIKYQNNKKRQVITILGFLDGSIEIYHLSLTSKAIFFKKLLSLQSQTKQAITSIGASNGHIYVTRLHEAEVYKDSLTIVANIIVKEQQGSKIQDKEYNCRSNPVPIKSLGEGLTLSMTLGKSSIHIFNESQGSKSFLLNSLQEHGTILDSITFMKETLQENLVIGDTNDKLKIIYKSRKLVERFQGFKNYCSDAFNRILHKGEELWVADYHGCITYFLRPLSHPFEVPNSSLKMIDSRIHFSMKICENGIKKLMICGKVLIVMDSQSNIHLFDIIRKESESDNEQLQLESVEEFSSENQIL